MNEAIKLFAQCLNNDGEKSVAKKNNLVYKSLSMKLKLLKAFSSSVKAQSFGLFISGLFASRC